MSFTVWNVPVPFGPQHGSIITSSPTAAYDLLVGAQAGQGSAIWPAANRSIFIPFEIASPRIAYQMMWHNGSAVSGNVDAGIYDTAGNLIVAVGGTGQTGTTTIQVADITDTLLQPGNYLMALALDLGGAGTAQTSRWAAPTTLTVLQAHGIRTVAANYPLAGPVTLASPASAYIPIMGVALHATV